MRKVMDDGMPHVLILDRHAFHATIDVLTYAMGNNIHLIQLPSHFPHITEPMNVCVFGMFKRNTTTALTRFPGANGMMIPVKSDIASIVREAWSLSPQSKIPRRLI